MESAAKVLPQANPFEFLRRIWGFRNDALLLCQQMYERDGAVVRQATPLGSFVHLFGPDANRFVLLDKEGALSARLAWEAIMGSIFTGGLLLRDGDDHRRARRLMHAAFTQEALRGYVDTMNERIAVGLAEWGNARGGFLAYPAIKRLTLDLAWRIFLGVEVGAGAERERLNQAFEAAVAASMSVVRLRIPGLEFERGVRGREHMIGYFRSLLPAKRARRTDDIASLLCHATDEAGDRLTDDEIIDHLIFLMMAAHDTTTSTLCSMLYELARSSWQDRLRAEAFAVGSERLEWNALASARDLDLVMSETLRRYPPLSTIPRFSTREISFDGYVIPPRHMVVVYPIHTHHMAEWWTDPFTFDPGRFAPPREEDRRHSHSYLPFGGGAHTCLGMRFAQIQVALLMHQLVRRYRWTVPAGYQMPVQQAPISKPRDGLPLMLTSLS